MQQTIVEVFKEDYEEEDEGEPTQLIPNSKNLLDNYS